jgi:hypothetical protein
LDVLTLMVQQCYCLRLSTVNSWYPCSDFNVQTEVQSAQQQKKKKNTVPMLESSKNLFGLVKNCVKFALPNKKDSSVMTFRRPFQGCKS